MGAIEILHCDAGRVLFRGETAATLAEAVRAAVASGADLSWANLGGADLSEADLSGANLSWANLCGADLCGADLSEADLSGANLCGADLCGADLSEADLSGANLSWANLRGADLTGADLTGADLSWANLGGANLYGARGLPEAPRIECLDARILAAIDTGGVLDMDDWHTCATTHCRAGWAITLAGEAGRNLEERYGPSVAGALIYHASAGRVPDFFASGSDALADIRACAAKRQVGE